MSVTVATAITPACAAVLLPSAILRTGKTVFADNGLSPHDVMAAIAASVHGEQRLEDVLWDGVFDPAKDNSDGSLNLCVKNNGAATFLNFDAPGDFANWSIDASPHDCSHPAVPPVNL